VLGLYDKIAVTAEKVWKYLYQSKSPLIAVLSEDLLKCVTKSATFGLVSCQRTFDRLTQSISGASPSKDYSNIVGERLQDYLQARYTDAASREDDLDNFRISPPSFILWKIL